MKIHTMIVAAALTALGAGGVIAQSDPIAMRKALMKENNDGAGVLVAMTRGTTPFDASKVDPVFAQWADTAQKLPGLFPDNSKTGDTRASPKIWETKADFDAKAADFAKVVADNRDKAKQSLDGLKAAMGAVGKVCSDCHGDYRLSRR
jgi:cytochrome c556